MLPQPPQYGTHICVPFGALGDALPGGAPLTANSLRLGSNIVKLGFSVHCGLILFCISRFFICMMFSTLVWKSMFSTADFAISAAGFLYPFSKHSAIAERSIFCCVIACWITFPIVMIINYMIIHLSQPKA